ncbi:hypothetical protein Cgig2_021674 [Carnegiea gigantea]|uniref:Uncharacterized protein n=1 Tax=Carnegiea gigantea TaxID=171969 RepID=A0A9Q1KSU2_9CARY|nr:hypothetical protein Cgig2_021674 [Carnegiea gigantea]
MRESFRWHWRSAIRSPRPLPDDYQDLCLRFTLSDAERALPDFELPEMIQATFYTLLLNDAIKLAIVSGFLAIDLKLTLEGLRWTSFEAWLSRTSRDLWEVTEIAAEYVRDTCRWHLRETSAQCPNPLPTDHHNLCLGFDHGVATQYAQDSNIPKMVQAIFYAIVVNDIVELGLMHRLIAECMMWVMQQLNWAPIEFWPENIDRRLRRARLPAPQTHLWTPHPRVVQWKTRA